MIEAILLILTVIFPPAVAAWMLWMTNHSRRAIVGASLCVLVAWSGRCFKIMLDTLPAREDEPCNLVVSSERYADAFHLIADLKQICGHMEDPERHTACTQNPILPQGNSGSCMVAKSTADELHGWVSARAPELYLACSQQGPCNSWAKTAKSCDGSPILK